MKISRENKNRNGSQELLSVEVEARELSEIFEKFSTIVKEFFAITKMLFAITKVILAITIVLQPISWLHG